MVKKNNPYTVNFGTIPTQYISRLVQTNDIINDFEADNPSKNVCMITGVRGSGKTVMMTSISNHFRENDDWIVVELNSNRDMLQSLAAKLYSIDKLHTYFSEATIDLSILGIGVSIKGASPISDVETALERMFEVIQKKKKKLLITVDEVLKNEYVCAFSAAFQIFLRHEYPIFLLMTGLYENIYELQNEKSLTFLYRAPKVKLDALNITAISKNFMNNLNIDMEYAEKLANLTKGYSFAFQVLGYLLWQDEKRELENVLPDFDQYLEEYVYEKIWMETSEQDRIVLLGVANTESTRVADIRESVGMDSAKFSVYRDRLKRKGIVDTSYYGKMLLTLPRFDVFVKSRFVE